MRATEFIVEGLVEGSLNEYRDQLWTWVQSKFPRTQWPEYVQRDFLYQQAKGIRNQAELDDFLKRNRNDFGKVQWRLEKLPITMNIFTPKTQRMILSREGGSSNPFQVPRDAERHAQQSQMIQQKGVSEEPIIVAKLSNGYDLIEGWHRTIQHLKEFPQGYTAPAWVGYGATYTSESVEQGVAEGVESLDYQGNCTEDEVVDEIFGDVNNFARMVEEHGDEFTVGKLVVKYDPETDIHSFYYKKSGVAEGFSNDMSTEDMIAYLRQHHDTNLHQDYLNHVNTFSKFVLKDIPTNTLKTDLPGLDREKVERYKKMDQSKAPPIVLGGKYILDGYHRANAVKELGITTIKAYVGVQGVAEGIDDSANLSRLQSVQSGRTALGLVNLPVVPSNDNPNTTAKVVNTGSRIVAVYKVRGVNIPFYISTGGGGKASVPTGKWYPVFGIHSSGWLNKGTEESINKFYGSKELARGAEILNKYLGDLRSVEDKIPLMKPDGYSIINKNLKPMSWNEVDSNVNEFKKRINAILVQIGDAPHYPEVEYTKNDKKSQIVHLQNLAKFYPNITMKDFVNQGKEKIINDAMLEVNQLKNYYGQHKQANFVQLLSNLENDIDSFKRGSLANTNNQNSVPNLGLLLKGTLGKINFATP